MQRLSDRPHLKELAITTAAASAFSANQWYIVIWTLCTKLKEYQQNGDIIFRFFMEQLLLPRSRSGIGFGVRFYTFNRIWRRSRLKFVHSPALIRRPLYVLQLLSYERTQLRPLVSENNRDKFVWAATGRPVGRGGIWLFWGSPPQVARVAWSMSKLAARL